MLELTLPVHPTTGLRALGIVGGRPVWPILGGAPDDGTSGQGGDAGQQASGQDAGQQGGGAGQQTDSGQQTGSGDADPEGPRAGEDAAAFLARVGPEGAAKLALRYRQENGRDRSTGKAAAAEQARLELATNVAKALGLVPEDAGQVKPEQLQAQLDATAAAARASAVELALFKTAQEHGGTPGDLLAMLVLRNADQFDPAAPDFSSKVVSAAKAAVAANPALKATPAVAASGGQFGGGPVERSADTIQPGLDRLAYAYGNPGR